MSLAIAMYHVLRSSLALKQAKDMFLWEGLLEAMIRQMGSCLVTVGWLVDSIFDLSVQLDYLGCCWVAVWLLHCPICSMYGIFTYIWLKCMVNVGKYFIHGASGCKKDNSGGSRPGISYKSQHRSYKSQQHNVLDSIAWYISDNGFLWQTFGCSLKTLGFLLRWMLDFAYDPLAVIVCLQ